MSYPMFANGWLPLSFAIIFGVLGTIAMKISHGFNHLKPSILLAIFYTLSFVALNFALKHIDLGVVYAVWSGAGTVLVALISAVYLDEKLTLKKGLYLTLIILGVIGIHFSDCYL